MNDGNVMLDGKKYDTGMKWVDSSGVSHPVYRKKITTGALPNATGKNVAHAETGITLTKYARVISFYATKASTAVLLMYSDVKIELDATNVIITTGTNLSTYTASEVVIEWAE